MTRTPPHRSLALALGMLGVGVLCAGLIGCDDDIGAGELVGSLEVPGCVDGETARFVCEDTPIERCEALRLTFDFFSLEQLGNAARITMQRGGQILGRTDGILLEIKDLRLIRGRLGQSLPVGLDANVRVGLGLFELCPDTTQNFAISGSVVFDALGVESGDRVAGRIERLEVRDGRSVDGRPGAVLGLLRGDFDFTLQVGPPYQRFSR